ncbi:MAG: hypothetical protein DRJ68_01140 [Thermoprotei archaeon]|nr:MAG: hypothetical protein DRJ68_01140 [Thermoprotei archaeon]
MSERVLTVIPILTPEHPALSKLYLLVVTTSRVMGLYAGGLLTGFDKVMMLFEALGSASVSIYPFSPRAVASASSSIPLDEPIMGEEAEVDIEELERILTSRRSNFSFSLEELDEIKVEPRRGTDTFHKLTIRARGKSKKFLVNLNAVKKVEGILRSALKDKVKIIE